jgi:hypothetical protein
MYEGVSCLRAQDMKSEFLSQMLIEAMIVGNISTEEASGHPPCTHPPCTHPPCTYVTTPQVTLPAHTLSLSRRDISPVLDFLERHISSAVLCFLSRASG